MSDQDLRSNSEFVPLKKATALVPGGASYLAIWRWCRVGLKVKGVERRIRLKHRRLGKHVYTTARWLDEFMKTLTEADQVGKARRPKVKRIRLRAAARREIID